MRCVIMLQATKRALRMQFQSQTEWNSESEEVSSILFMEAFQDFTSHDQTEDSFLAARMVTQLKETNKHFKKQMEALNQGNRTEEELISELQLWKKQRDQSQTRKISRKEKIFFNKTMTKILKLSEKREKREKQRSLEKKKPVEQKTKPEEVHSKEIAKYMESHGQIQHGKEFQSDIPAVKICNGIWFNRWLEEKRKNILRRQVGTLTY